MGRIPYHCATEHLPNSFQLKPRGLRRILGVGLKFSGIGPELKSGIASSPIGAGRFTLAYNIDNFLVRVRCIAGLPAARKNFN